MQIDFHHATTYVIARLAGFNHKKAEIIAHASQYVDDATSSGTVRFSNKAMYNRISSAHKMLDERNFQELANHLVWLPFHFLPGNGGMEAGKDPSKSFIDKIVCKPNSPIAQELVKHTILEQDRTYGLHRLGVTMHVYADTWAHQGFAGVLHEINEVEDAKEIGKSEVFTKRLGSWLRDILDDAIPPLGHGRANIFPDMPFLEWQYMNGKGKLIKRNNTDFFYEAANEMCKAMKRYRLKDPEANVTGLKEEDEQVMRQLFTSVKEKKGEKRHKKWLDRLKKGVFKSIGKVELSYTGKGKGSWKQESLGSNFDEEVYKYHANFLGSDWKLFHDAIQAHRFYMIHDLLPKYGICAA